ncbi:hypothetical protein [Dyadobacter fermentans]|uniref:Lipoprotein n=1 Tax=Dyadobacter fermentans (strain ATCC 700827 / DSM 18053 / CIP 107007 / KCTC 52180 / NS114) TaxID=471854 RepID=C6VYH3_DYAFD|nr:hypothetical protein [Dyadobacter fermentans]ACT91652.1 hypothetical protein Dfer_0383 [Dyadobacter fermentans DSM 18053]
MKVNSRIQFALVAMMVACNSGDTSIKVKDDDDYYRFTAQFDEDKSPAISRFISEHISPVRVDPERDSKIVTVLDDQTKLTVESAPGEIMIYLDKDENSRASYHRVKNLCEGVKEIIMGHR